LCRFAASRGHKYWLQDSRRLLAPTRPDSTGKFTFRRVPPGEYFLCALTDFEQQNLSKPSFLDQLVGASIKITLAEGEKKTQDLKLGGR
jgi:hypothetical protein